MAKVTNASDDWRWPEEGGDPEALRAQIAALPSPYEGPRRAVCFPGTPIARVARAFDGVQFLARQLNHIGTHTQHAREREGGFEDSQGIEACAVWKVADVLGGDRGTVDGYFCGGATEANAAGLWIGREFLRRHPDPMRRGIVVLVTPLTHYSVHKATAILDIGQASPRFAQCPRCHREHLFVPDPTGRGVTRVGMNERWEMDMAELDCIFRLKYEEGFRQFLIVPTIGTTATGSIDPVAEIGEFVRRKQRETLARCYVHVDAAFGGFTVPFVQPERAIGFQIPEVQSIAVDADKMGQLPYPAGIFLCRKDLPHLIGRQVTYISGHEDDTVCGSRTALAPILAWYQFNADGRAGQRAYVYACIRARDRLVELIRQRLPWANILRHSEAVNILPVELPIDPKNGDVPEVLTKSYHGEEIAGLAERLRPCAGFLAPYQLRADYVPSEPRDPESCPKVVYKICVMPHLFSYDGDAQDGANGTPSDALLVSFVEDLAEAKRRWDAAGANSSGLRVNEHPTTGDRCTPQQ